MPIDGYVLYPARSEDARELAATTRAGFETFREWMPPGWAPPDHRLEILNIRVRLGRSDTWSVLARVAGADGAAGEPAGHVAITPGTLRDPPRRLVPGLAHLWMLFVRPPHWGTGLAGRLHELALDEARSRGYERIQLHTPEGQARARAFYERRGWEREGPAFTDPLLALRIVRYVRRLDR